MGPRRESAPPVPGARELGVTGAFVFAPEAFPDHRGVFLSPYREAVFSAAVGRPRFPVVQTNHTRSAAGVLRGVHFTLTPPGAAKYVYCAHGRALDLVVDLRVDSPGFGTWSAVPLEARVPRAVYLPVGVGHAVLALEDDTVMSYLMTAAYAPELEHSVAADDPELGLPIPTDPPPIRSERDHTAPRLAEHRRAGRLPTLADCARAEAEIFR
ncbi:dTDP-4-dehydrorhamnose 3,5-epimerase [Streptomyces calidiresistens]|uniref:dTDP-4-keto-6-deoxy-D-glucose epimerase n=1 Tax=Streptomyces calidiresistens TaxID=1485586 RepID=A0A7W3T4V6_9ACTN|nr:dTDP-4-dehydrorhamnose 3,5-epimerase family protein [Streptomyces calidiresistens]MBB0230711.1 dTDP-4-keto-6-deoxy-D-glucose epimerase [Streptomyces calidiresistens]